MSWLQAMSAPEMLFRFTTTGQRVFAPAGRLGRVALVSDEHARRMQRDARHIPVWLFALVLGLARALPDGGWWAPAATGLGVGLAARYWLARGLPRLPRRGVTLVPVDRHARQLAFARATGSDELWLFFSGAVFGALTCLVAAARFGVGEGRWLAGLLTWAAFIAARQIRVLQSADRLA